MAVKRTDRFNSFVLLFLAIWPIFYSVIFVFFWMFNLRNQPLENYIGLGFLLMCHILTMGVSLAGIVLYLFNLYHNNRVIGNNKMLYALGILFLGIICLPLYRWRYVKPDLRAS
jgi:hypothetical protein